MDKGRLEAFSDGVIAIIITIMVLELKVPHEPTWAALSELLPVFLSYVLSFANVGNLLEQSPPPTPGHQPGERHDPLGQPAPAVLALADAVRDRLGWARTTFATLPVALYGV